MYVCLYVCSVCVYLIKEVCPEFRSRPNKYRSRHVSILLQIPLGLDQSQSVPTFKLLHIVVDENCSCIAVNMLYTSD